MLHHLQHDEDLLRPPGDHLQPPGLSVHQAGRGGALPQGLLSAWDGLGGVAGPVSDLQWQRLTRTTLQQGNISFTRFGWKKQRKKSLLEIVDPLYFVILSLWKNKMRVNCKLVKIALINYFLLTK